MQMKGKQLNIKANCYYYYYAYKSTNTLTEKMMRQQPAFIFSGRFQDEVCFSFIWHSVSVSDYGCLVAQHAHS